MNESVQKWLDDLVSAPSAAIQKLVLGYAGVSAWSRSSLRESLIETFPTHAEALDDGLASWLEERLGKLPPENTPTLVWASHLQDLFSAIAGLPLKKVAHLLRDRMRDFRSWLRPLRTTDGLDPEAAFLSALAWAETNQNLEGLWRGLTLRRDHEPAYYTDVGLLGLRMTRDARGALPPKAPFLLLATLIDLADTPYGRKNWLLTARSLMGGYHCRPDTWTREFEPILDARPNAQNGPDWLRLIIPLPRAGNLQMRAPGQLPSGTAPIPLSESSQMVRAVSRLGLGAQGLESLLERHRAYASATGESHFLVRTFNRLAEAAQSHDPDWAIARAEEAMEWDPDHEFCWTALARALWSSGMRAKQMGDGAAADDDCREAMDTLWKARFRFPYNAHVRTELAKMLCASDDFATAEVVYREAQAEFPRNPWAFTGLADMLLRIDRETGSQTHLEESISMFQHAAELGSKYAARRLRSISQNASDLEGGEPSLDAEEGESIGSLSLPILPTEEMRPAQRLGRALLIQWQARQTELPATRDELFAEVERLLDFPDELAGECLTAFIEARGFLMLARDNAAGARAYFAQQFEKFGNRGPLGLRLGLAESLARLGEPLSEDQELELDSFGPQESILPLVLRVVRLLESADSDDVLRGLLMELYPRVRELASMPASELGDDDEERSGPRHQPESPDTMMANLLIASVFQTADIGETDDLKDSEAIPRVRDAFSSHRSSVLSVVEKLALVA